MIAIRFAKKDDVSKVSEIHAFCWRETYSFMPEAVLRSRNQEFRRLQWLNWFESRSRDEALFVLEADDDIVGFCFCCPNRDDAITGSGEMHAAYVLPKYRGREVGPLMMLTMLDFMEAHGLTPPALWAFKNNPIRLWYAQLGWRSEVKRDRVIENVAIPEVGYVCDDCRTLRARLTRLISRYGGETALKQTQPRFRTLQHQNSFHLPVVSHGNSQTVKETGLQTRPDLL
mgnify:CR=1 FL=1